MGLLLLSSESAGRRMAGQMTWGGEPGPDDGGGQLLARGDGLLQRWPVAYQRGGQQIHQHRQCLALVEGRRGMAKLSQGEAIVGQRLAQALLGQGGTAGAPQRLA
jgi:hypothetical protein